MIPKGDPRFKLIAYCIHIGLRLLEHAVGNTALVETASKILPNGADLKRQARQRCSDAAMRERSNNVYDMGDSVRPLSGMKHWVNDFLEKVRADSQKSSYD